MKTYHIGIEELSAASNEKKQHLHVLCAEAPALEPQRWRDLVLYKRAHKVLNFRALRWALCAHLSVA